MSDTPTPRLRIVTARRVSTLTGLAALTAAGMIAATGVHAEGEGEGAEAASTLSTEAEGEGHGASHAAASEAAAGEGEGGAQADDDVSLLTGLGFMEGHIRAGLALYAEGDVTAAKTHMGHPIEEKYGAVAEQLKAAGHGALEGQIRALAAATEAEAELAAIEALFDEVRATMEAARADYPETKQIEGLIALTRIAGEEYAVAVGDGETVTDLHEYQDSWGFLQVVGIEAGQMAENGDAELAGVAQAILAQVAETGAVYGDLQGGGEFAADPAVIHGAAARMELAALKLDVSDTGAEGEGEGEGHSEGEGEGEGDAASSAEGEGEGN